MRRLLATAAAGLALALPAAAAGAVKTPVAAVRVDQLGFASGETKIAYLLARRARPSAPFELVDDAGTVVLSGRAGASRGRWNKRYGAVQPLDVSALTAPGTHRVRVDGTLGGTVNLEGGWLDAGDFVKFTHTIAYADVLRLASARALGASAPASLDPEGRFGLRFLRQAWNPRTGVLALQVGIGSGNEAGTFYGDQDTGACPSATTPSRGGGTATSAHDRPSAPTIRARRCRPTSPGA